MRRKGTKAVLRCQSNNTANNTARPSFGRRLSEFGNRYARCATLCSMQYHALTLTIPLRKYPRPLRLIMPIVVAGLMVVLEASAQTQATRQRRVTPELEAVATRKRPAKLKPLTAANHREAEQRLADLGDRKSVV